MTGRRYFRLLDFYGCFERVHVLSTTPSSAGAVLATMELAQFTFLGLYLFLENFTIVLPLRPPPLYVVFKTDGLAPRHERRPGGLVPPAHDRGKQVLVLRTGIVYPAYDVVDFLSCGGYPCKGQGQG